MGAPIAASWTIESWRDAMLAATGRLNFAIGGPDRNLDDADNNRRTLYGTVRRRELHAMLRLNDFPDPTTHNASRDLTTTHCSSCRSS